MSPGILVGHIHEIATEAKGGNLRAQANSTLMELETAKEIQIEIFHTRPGEVEEMIQRRLEETNWLKEKEI
jgi:hypothetical protein